MAHEFSNGFVETGFHVVGAYATNLQGCRHFRTKTFGGWCKNLNKNRHAVSAIVTLPSHFKAMLGTTLHDPAYRNNNNKRELPIKYAEDSGKPTFAACCCTA